MAVRRRASARKSSSDADQLPHRHPIPSLRLEVVDPARLRVPVPIPPVPRQGMRTRAELGIREHPHHPAREIVEPHPHLPRKFRIIDGDRRWSNSKVLVEQGKHEYRQIPVEVTDRTLSDEECHRLLRAHAWR